jgi:hypothetical protein
LAGSSGTPLGLPEVVATEKVVKQRLVVCRGQQVVGGDMLYYTTHLRLRWLQETADDNVPAVGCALYKVPFSSAQAHLGGIE